MAASALNAVSALPPRISGMQVLDINAGSRNAFPRLFVSYVKGVFVCLENGFSP